MAKSSMSSLYVARSECSVNERGSLEDGEEDDGNEHY